MARRTKEEAEQTRRDILEAALDEFYECGYTNSTLNSIAKRTGFTKGAIYWHFKNKKDLFQALYSEIVSLEDHSYPGFHELYPTLSELQHLTMSFLEKTLNDQFLSKYYALVLLRMEWTEDLKPFRDQFLKESRDMAIYYRGALQACIERGEVSRHIQPASTGAALVSLQNGLLADALFEGEQVSPEQFKVITAGIEVFFRGLAVSRIGESEGNT